MDRSGESQRTNDIYARSARMCFHRRPCWKKRVLIRSGNYQKVSNSVNGIPKNPSFFPLLCSFESYDKTEGDALIIAGTSGRCIYWNNILSDCGTNNIGARWGNSGNFGLSNTDTTMEMLHINILPGSHWSVPNSPILIKPGSDENDVIDYNGFNFL